MFLFLHFFKIAAKSLIDFVLFYQIAQTHLELMLFQKNEQLTHQYLCYFVANSGKKLILSCRYFFKSHKLT